jgi:hypothetical protein
MEADEFIRLKRKAESLQRQAAEAQGALKQLLAGLKERYGVDSLEAGAKLLKRKERLQKEAEERRDEALRTFREKYGDWLEER